MLTHIRRPRLAVAGLIALAVAAATLSPSPSGPPPAAAQGARASSDAPAFLVPVSSVLARGTHAGIEGDHLKVQMRPSALPMKAGAQFSVPLGSETGVVNLSRVQSHGEQASWSGSLDGVDASSFTMVKVAGVYRGSLSWPGGNYSLAIDADGAYWWTRVQPRTEPVHGSDAVVAPVPASAAPAGAMPAMSDARRKRRSKVKIIVAYTRPARRDAGGKAGIKAAGALIVAQTNDAYRASGVKVKLRLKGVVKAKGKQRRKLVQDLTSLRKPRDGRYDNLHRLRRKRSADLVHLLTGGEVVNWCGFGYIPITPRRAHRSLGFSVGAVGCIPQFSSTHEISHNLGADHDRYPGVSHYSRMRNSYGFVNPAGGYMTIMGYPNKCYDAGAFCWPLAFMSNPRKNYNGWPLSSGKRTNNHAVINKVAPRVARYMR